MPVYNTDFSLLLTGALCSHTHCSKRLKTGSHTQQAKASSDCIRVWVYACGQTASAHVGSLGQVHYSPHRRNDVALIPVCSNPFIVLLCTFRILVSLSFSKIFRCSFFFLSFFYCIQDTSIHKIQHLHLSGRCGKASPRCQAVQTPRTRWHPKHC